MTTFWWHEESAWKTGPSEQEPVRPERDEHCESKSACDSALSVKSYVNDIELHGETDDDDIEGRGDWIR